MIGIYKIENIIDGKKYIGSSIDIEKRFLRHKNELIKNKHNNIHLKRAVDKYGIVNFIFECIEECDKDVLLEQEQKYLDMIFSLERPFDFYYNIGKQSSGGDNLTNNPNRKEIIENIRLGGLKRYENMSDNEKEIISENLMGVKNPNYGKRWNQEQRQKMRENRKGLPSKIKGKNYEEIHGKEKGDEKKKKISEKAKLRTGDKNSFFGKKHSNETKLILSESLKGKKSIAHINNSTPFSIDGKNYILLTEASEYLNIKWATIRHRINSDNPKYSEYKYLTDIDVINDLKKEFILKHNIN